MSAGPASVAIERRVEWADTDASGHHHNTAVVRWFEIAEARLLDRAGLLHEIYDRLPRVRIEIDFLRSVRFGDRVAMEVRVERVGESSLTFAFELRAAEGLAARGSVVAALRTRAGAAQPWPAAWRRRLLQGGPARDVA